MLFDGVCNLCNGGVRFVRGHDPNRSIRYIPLQSESGRKLLQRSGRAPDDISSVVFVEKDRSYIKSEAVLRIMEYLNLPFPQLATSLKFVPLCNLTQFIPTHCNIARFLRDIVYDNVADNRYGDIVHMCLAAPVQDHEPLNLTWFNKNVLPPGMIKIGQPLSLQVSSHAARNAFSAGKMQEKTH
ncbi:hypothetical protein E2562_034844 [Oryza meyeriana var. granulata]|uniref:Uncharacterized protein n=1 Tax=Oryza meyeriana var. granulata TaxID=110450 RepID=A0A6G1E6P3_9ORYZ|nr:hypothetical protein E2562_034844 [Oryza meyeriana var. granulata]